MTPEDRDRLIRNSWMRELVSDVTHELARYGHERDTLMELKRLCQDLIEDNSTLLWEVVTLKDEVGAYALGVQHGQALARGGEGGATVPDEKP